MPETRQIIVTTCLAMAVRQIRPFVSNFFTTSFNSEFMHTESRNAQKAYKFQALDDVNVSTTNFLWFIAPLFVLLFPGPDSFRCKSVLIYGTILELYRSLLFSMPQSNPSVEAALPQVSPIFETFFSTTTFIYCIYLYNKVDNRMKNHRITLYVFTSVFLGTFINTYFIQLSSNLKTSSDMNFNYIAVPILTLMLFTLIPQRSGDKYETKDAAANRCLEENHRPKRIPYWIKFWNDFKFAFRYSEVRKWSVCWWLHDILLIGITRDFTNILLTTGLFTNTSDTLEWVTWINSLGLLSSAVITGLIAPSNFVWKTYINWFPCTAPLYYIGWSLITGVPPLLMISLYYIYCTIIFRFTFAISVSQLAKYVPTDKHVIVFCFNSMMSLAIKMIVLKAIEMYLFSDVIFKGILVIGIVIYGKVIFTTATDPKNGEAW